MEYSVTMRNKETTSHSDVFFEKNLKIHSKCSGFLMIQRFGRKFMVIDTSNENKFFLPQ